MLHTPLMGVLSQVIQEGHISDQDYRQLLESRKTSLKIIEGLVDMHKEGEAPWISEQIDDWLVHAIADFHVLTFLVEAVHFGKIEGIFIEGMQPLNEGQQLTSIGQRVVALLNHVYRLGLYGYQVEIVPHPHGSGDVLQFFLPNIPP